MNILNQLSLDNSNKALTLRLFKSISYDNLRKSFNNYRWNLKNISKQINFQFYTYLYHLSLLIDENLNSIEGQSIEQDEIRSLCGEINFLYKIKEINGSIEKPKKLDTFVHEMPLELYFIFTKITLNFSKNEIACKEICSADSYYLIHLTSFLSEFLLEVNLKKAKNISSLYYNCVFNTITCIDNILKYDDLKKGFFRILNIININMTSFKEKLLDVGKTFENYVKKPNQDELNILISNFSKKLE